MYRSTKESRHHNDDCMVVARPTLDAAVFMQAPQGEAIEKMHGHAEGAAFVFQRAPSAWPLRKIRVSRVVVPGA